MRLIGVLEPEQLVARDVSEVVALEALRGGKLRRVERRGARDRAPQELAPAREAGVAPVADLTVELVPALIDGEARIQLEVALDERVAEGIPIRSAWAR